MVADLKLWYLLPPFFFGLVREEDQVLAELRY